MLDLKLTDMRFMYLTELRGKDICVGDKKCALYGRKID